jgi:hypothetical protein
MKQLLLCTFILFTHNLSARAQYDDYPPPEFKRREPVYHSDVVRTNQASALKKSCIVVNKTRERICDLRAQKWCDEHKDASECKHFFNTDVSR